MMFCKRPAIRFIVEHAHKDFTPARTRNVWFAEVKKRLFDQQLAGKKPDEVADERQDAIHLKHCLEYFHPSPVVQAVVLTAPLVAIFAGSAYDIITLIVAATSLVRCIEIRS